jgi:membrane-bound serine protease (ClpP class)
MKKSIISLIILLSLLFAAPDSLVYRVPIEGTIDLGLPPFIERSLKTAAEEGAVAVIFDIDTFGGRVDAATQIKDAILDSPLLTVAFINRRAISAGALISMSCDKIYMTRGGTIGAATAVDMQGKKGSEKVISYMREEMASTAESTGRNINIAKGMVDEELNFTHLVVNGDSVEVLDMEGRKEGKLITLTTELAKKYKIADGDAETFDELLAKLGLEGAEVISTKATWSEAIVRFLTNPVVASLLMTFGFLGILFELQQPGWGVSGTIGAVCLALALGAGYIAELASATDFLIIFVGILLLLIEMIVIPGFGLAGIGGIILVVFGLYRLLLPDIPVGEEVADMAMFGLSIGIIGGLIGLVLLFRLMTKTKFWKKLATPDVQDHKRGYDTSLGLEDMIGQVCVADSDLHPSGWVTIGNKRIFVVSEGTFIEDGEKVKIIKVDGNRVVVRQIKK